MPIEGFIWSVTYYAIEELIRKIYPKIVTMFDDPDSDFEDESVGEDDEEKSRKPERVMYILGQVLDDDEVY